MKCLVGFGSNVGDRLSHLEAAARILAKDARSKLRASPVFQNAALVPPGAPDVWHQPFLNAVVELDWEGSVRDLLALLKATERQLGRTDGARWAPRPIDLDLILFGSEVVSDQGLVVPHPEAWNRQFVLSPLKHLRPELVFPGQKKTVLQRAREVSRALPLWMGILNLTPDSFSDGGSLATHDAFKARFQSFTAGHVQILDVGAESTRPNAQKLTPAEEWARLGPALQWASQEARGRTFRPLISVDSYHAKTMVAALELGVDMINDVSGLADDETIELLAASDCQYVLMHSLSVPADPRVTISAGDPVDEIKSWALAKLAALESRGVSLERVSFDPGIGFGKTPAQSAELIRRIEEFFSLPVRILVGHSRKSFFKLWGAEDARDRDMETLGASLLLAEKGVDILRVHEPLQHQRARRVFEDLR